MSVLSPTTRSNFRNLYADIAWFGVLSGSAIAFLNIYAARLGASAAEIGLLTAGPAVVNLLFSLPAGRWLESHSVIRASYWSALGQRIGYVAMIFLPWLFAEQMQVRALIWLSLLMSVPATYLAIGFNTLLADVVPVEQRATVVGRRNALLAITMTVSTLISGQILDWLPFPANYQVIFLMGAIGGLMSAYHLSLIRAPEGLLQPELSPRPLSLVGRRVAVTLPDVSLLRGVFGRFMAAYLLFYTFQYLALPLFPLAFVDILNLSDGMISLGNGLFYGTMFLISLRLSRLARRYGHHKLLIASSMGLALYPALIGLARGVPLYLIASLVGGLVWGLLSASLINRLIERVPEENRRSGMAMHNVVFNLGILAGSLLGPLLGDWIGIREAILVTAVLRFLAGCLIIVWG